MGGLGEFIAALSVFEIIGIFGFLFYLLAFGAVQLGCMNGNGVTYSLTNVLAASLVAVSLTADFNLASALIQGSWILIGLIGLALRAHRARSRLRSAMAARAGRGAEF